MKAILFTRETLNPKAPTDDPVIRLFPSDGRVAFNKALCQSLQLNNGDTIAIIQDEENSNDWYIVPKYEGGFYLRGSKGQLRVTSSPLVNMFTGWLGDESGQPLCYTVDTTPVKKSVELEGKEAPVKMTMYKINVVL